ncbi:MAG: M1 family metallopeptidase [Candidatus Marinimicrobia bacterium]|nr:M1 family metallopeptidase [Candidatus Neomarinimicrobiota bacterium]MBT5339184.1 M1 family metallopeptidase [Candidatus Neomarinimicrobiota bacterium]MBT6369330.1 M1 family metallopeptidase [Candidatus Neomarinimicrobiota bacterium]MBT7872721.1 M1 family metallopeptidase [Candidatus Neomarinimicrobiota bacterium]
MRILLVCCTSATFLNASNDYWQQFVQYKMDVSLDINEHTVGGKSIITYTNNSPDNIQNMYLHLLPNAFQEGSVKHREYLQKFGRLGRAAKFIEGMDSYFSKVVVSNFSIMLEGTTLSDTFQMDDTILSSSLSKPLKPGETLTMEFDWVHHVGEQVERAGRVDEQYNFAQWYPKVVVYDENGWHNIPFHAEGEFYGEFGTFDVTLDVPAWYTVGATGIVTDGDPGWQNVAVDTSADFEDWLEKYQENKVDIDSAARRTVSFHAEQVHDFAWITSPNFLYEHGAWNGIDVHVLFNEKNGKKWTKKVTARSERALEWLSTKFGMYPYPQVTTTDRLKGGGMEYPMLVMNGSESESLIVHEIGHIWFYGIMGNDEVSESWLDEGFTTFQTGQYMINRYGAHGFDLDASKRYKSFEKKHGKFTSFLDRAQWSTIRFQTSGKDEPISRKSYMFNNGGSYRYNAYTKPGLMLVELNYVLGDSLFYASMQEYFDRWHLKHVNEERFISSVENISGEKLDWFFNPWLHNTRILDYGIDSWSKTKQSDGSWKVDLNIVKHGTREMPQLLEITFADGSAKRLWWINHQWRKDDTFLFNVQRDPKSIVLDPDGMTIDVDRRNNYSGRMPREWQFDWINTGYNPRDSFYGRWTPTLSYHELDGYIPGFRMKRKYGYWEYLQTGLHYASKSNHVYWSWNVDRKLVHSFAGFSSSLHAFDFGGVSGYGLEMKNHLNEAFADFLTHDASIGFYVTHAIDTMRTNLFDVGQVVVLFSRYNFSVQELVNINVDVSTTPGSISDWSFTRFNAIASVDYSSGKFGFRNRIIVGHISSETGVPSQERYTIEGAGSGDLYRKPFLRDATSFYGNTQLRGHYHLPGDANLRGYYGENLVGSESVITNSFELFFNPGLKVINIELAAFIDDGWIWGSKFTQGDGGFKGDYLLDAGLGMRMKKSIFGKEFTIRIDVPLMVKDISSEKNGYQFRSDKWLFSFSKGI